MSKETALASLASFGAGSTNATPHQETTGAPPPEKLHAEPPAGSVGTKPAESDRFAQLAKKEARLQQEREALKREREEVETSRKPFRDFEELVKKDKIEALRSLGFTEADIFNFAAESEKKEPTPAELAEAAADKRIQAFKDEQAKKEAEAKAESDKAAITRFKGSMTEFLKDPKNAEKYEYCAFNGALAEDLAYRAIEQVLADTKGEDFMSLDEAFQMVEDLYEEEDRAMSSLKKRQPKTGEVTNPSGGSVPEEPLKAKVTPMSGTKTTTLTNKMTATGAATAAVNKNETREQKKGRLAEMLRTGNFKR